MAEGERQYILEKPVLMVPTSSQRAGISSRKGHGPLLSPSVCESGWRCCLINRDRKMPTDYIRNGVLYVTEK